MIPPLGRGHRGGTLSISRTDSISMGRSGAHSRHTRVVPVAAAEGPAAARDEPTVGEEGP